MELQFIFNVIANISIILGILFGLTQLRHYHKSRQRDSAITLLNSYQTAEFSKGIWKVLSIPDGSTYADIEARLGEDMSLIFSLMNTWESIGFLVFQNEFALGIVDDSYGGLVTYSWGKLASAVLGLREVHQMDTMFQWFQWLAERLEERRGRAAPVPAYIKHKGWLENNKADSTPK